MVGLKKAQDTIINATETVKDSSNLLMIVAGAAIVISTIALVVAVTRK